MYNRYIRCKKGISISVLVENILLRLMHASQDETCASTQNNSSTLGCSKQISVLLCALNESGNFSKLLASVVPFRQKHDRDHEADGAAS